MPLTRRSRPKALVKVEDYSLPATTEQEQTFRAFYERQHGPLIDFAARLLLDWDDAKDVVHDVMLDAWSRWPVLVLDMPPDRYFFGAVAKRAEDMRRRRFREHKRLERFLPEVIARTMSRPIGPDELLERAEAARVLDVALAIMSEQPLKAWALVRDYGMTHAQVGEALGLARSTVSHHMKRANDTIRKAFADAGYEDDGFLTATQLPMLLPTTAGQEEADD
jgi:RNA polymerase sigma-70 factor (ECF subfamily)